MTTLMSREIRMACYPLGLPREENFTLTQTPLAPLDAEQVMVRNRFMSVDPYMRRGMAPNISGSSPYAIGKPLTGGAIGEVIESRAAGFTAGDIVLSNYGWREYFISPAVELQAVHSTQQPLSMYLGVLGMTGLTAWVGVRLAEIKNGDIIFISGAAGAVGNVAGQLAKLRGCRVIGSAGSVEKMRILRETCGFDAAFNYKDGAISDQLRSAAPDGIDVYFDNVGGETLEAALSAMRVHGRIVICGGISGYNAEAPQPGPANLMELVGKRLTMKGLFVRDWLDQQSAFKEEVGASLRDGRIKNLETVVDGIEHAVEAFIGLFHGKNIGKMVVKLG